MKQEELKKYIINKFYKKRVYFTDEEGKQKDKSISKSHATDIYDSLLILDPSENNIYVDALARTFLKENKKLYTWLISSYYTNDRLSKENLKTFHKSLKFYHEHKELFDPYEQNLNNFSDIDEFVNNVNSKKSDYDNEESEIDKEESKKKELKDKKSKLDILKSTKVADDKLLLGKIDFIENEFSNSVEFQEINTFIKETEDLDYVEFFDSHDIRVTAELLDGFVKSISKDDQTFFGFAYDIAKVNGGVYSIIDIEEEINNKSINKIDDLSEFMEYISIESIFQYFSEFTPDIYEFFESSIIYGSYKKIIDEIEAMYNDFRNGGIIESSLLNIKFQFQHISEYSFNVYVPKSYIKRIYEMDARGELRNKLENTDLLDYVANLYVNQYSDDIRKIFKYIVHFNEGKLLLIDYDESVSFLKSRLPEIRQKYNAS